MNSFEGLSERDSVRIHRKDDSGRFTTKIAGIRYEVGGMLLLLDGDWRQNDEVYLIQTASMARHYKPVLPKSLDRFHKFPSRHSAPRPSLPYVDAKKLDAVMEPGSYALVGKVADLHAVLAIKPRKAMIFFSKLNAEVLRREEQSLPFRRDRLILWLDPYFPQSDAEWLVPELDYWIARVFRLL